MFVPQFAPFVDREEFLAIEECFTSNWITEGSKAEAFIGQLKAMLGAKYAYGLDTAADNGNYFANVFTSDGSFGNTKGREALAAMAREGGGRIKFRGYQHLVQNVIIEPTAEGAVGSQYIQVMTVGSKDKPPMLDHGGRYEDVYVKTAEGWRIKSRRVAHTFPPRE